MKLINVTTQNLRRLNLSICSLQIALSIPKGYYCKTTKAYTYKLLYNHVINLRVYKLTSPQSHQ